MGNKRKERMRYFFLKAYMRIKWSDCDHWILFENGKKMDRKKNKFLIYRFDIIPLLTLFYFLFILEMADTEKINVDSIIERLLEGNEKEKMRRFFCSSSLPPPRIPFHFLLFIEQRSLNYLLFINSTRQSTWKTGSVEWKRNQVSLQSSSWYFHVSAYFIGIGSSH